RAYSDHQPFDFYHRVVRPDGTVRTIHAHGEVFVDPGGSPLRMAGTGQDVTEAKQAEDQLRSYTLQLEQNQKQLAALNQSLSAKNKELGHANVELMNARKQLADDQTRFLIHAMPHIVATASPDGALLYANEHLHEYTGLNLKT